MAFAVCAAMLLALHAPAQSEKVVIGSKNFTESAVLAEVMAQMLEAHTDLVVERRINLGGTMICWAALRAGEIDVYADYTGTGWAEILKEPDKITDPLRAFLHVERQYRQRFGIRWLQPFGLNNSYALAMTEARAAELGVSRISDLVEHRDVIRAGFSVEFGSRETDGYPGLSKAYGLELTSVRTLEHGLAYQAITSGEIDLIDAYSTDGKLLRYRLRVLEDDRQFFPPYNAAPLVRTDTLERHPEIEDVLLRLAFRIPDDVAQQLNYQVEAEGRDVAAVAFDFLKREGLLGEEASDRGGSRRRSGFFAMIVSRPGELLELGLQHVLLTLAAVALAALLAIPLGILITKRARLRQVVLGAAGILQTIPSLALLAFMIPLFGLNVNTAIAALFLYAILPILRNTYTGIAEVDPDLVDAARGMGMRPGQILRRVQLPLAMRTIMAGVRTSTVISIGVATLAAFIGAGGLGAPIVQGLYLNDTNLILFGAVPAALLAIAADWALGRVEIALQPRTQSGG
jgi:osmoprotectant transport system permease protein